MTIFLESIKQNIPKIDSAFKTLCDSEIQIKELDAAIKQMSAGKSPGQDGLTSNFLQVFLGRFKRTIIKCSEGMHRKE